MMYARVRFGIQQCLLLLVFQNLLYAQTPVSPRGTAPEEGIRFQPTRQIAITNAKVVTKAGAEPIAAKLLIEGDQLLAVGDFTVTAAMEEINLSGKTIYPAFIDAMVEMNARPVNSNAKHWNGAITPQLRMSESLELDNGQLESLRKSGIAVAAAVPKEGILKGQSCVVATGTQALELSLLRTTLFQHLKLYPSRNSSGYPRSPMGAVALARQTLSDAQWYQQAQRTAQADSSIAGPEYNAALEELQQVLSGAQTVVVDGTNDLYALRGDQFAREFSLRLIVRGSGREYRQLDAIHGTNRTYIVPVDFPEAPEVATREDIASTTLQELMHWRLAPENPAKLEQAGVDFVLSSDGLEKTTDLLPKVREAVLAGLSETAALNALTQRPAKLLGIEEVAGTLEAGKLANFIVMDGPLFEKKSKIDETWVQGERHAWTQTAEKDLRGQWNVELTGAIAGSYVLELSGDADKLKGKVGLAAAFDKKEASVEEKAAEEGQAAEGKEQGDEPETDKAESTTKDESSKSAPKPIELKNLKFDGYVLNATFETADLDSELVGAAVVSAALLPVANGWELVGNVDWPNGTQSRATAVLGDPVAAGSADKTEKEDSKSKEEEASATDDTKVACEPNFPLGIYGRSSPAEQTEWLLVKNATIWTCAEQGILESADMLVHFGEIHAIGTGLVAPEGARIVDAQGMHVSPGIIDCHSHMATDGGVNEGGQAVTAEVRIGDFIDPYDITIFRQLAGGTTAANILHGSANPIGGQNQVIKLRWGLGGEALKMTEAPGGIKFALGENVKQSNYSTPTSRYPQTRMGVEQIMRDRFEAAKQYRQEWQQWFTRAQGLPPRRDFELDAIVEILEGKRWIHCHSYRQDEILTMLRTLDDYDITIGSFQHILEGYKVADAMAKHGATGSSFSDWWAYKFEVYDAIPYNGALMHEAGVVVSFNSDDDELGRHLNHEAAKAMKYGKVPAEEALKFVTLNPAKQLRIDQWVGSLEVGKHADFVLWSGSPLSTLSTCEQTWIDGRKYFDRAEANTQRHQEMQLHRDLVQSIVSSGAKTRKSKPDDDPSYWWVRYDEFCLHHQHDDHDLEEAGQEESAND